MDHLATITDLSLLLPPVGQGRYRLLQDASRDSSAIGQGLAERLIEQNQRRQAASTRIAQIRGQRNVDAGHPEMILQTRALADADAEIERINSRVAVNNLTAAPRADLLRNINTWLRSTAAGHDFVDVELTDPPKLLKGETPATAIERVRRRLRELSADENRINSAPFPSSYAKQAAAAYLDRIAAAPIVSNLIEHGGGLVIDGKPIEDPITFATKLVSARVDTATGPGVAVGEQVDTVGLLAWLFRDQFLARIGEAIDGEAEDKIALSHEQRAEQLAVIRSDREHIEREEAHWLWASFSAGVVVEPRADMTPAAFLGVTAVRADRTAGRDHADAFAVARQAGQPAGPGDISIPGLT